MAFTLDDRRWRIGAALASGVLLCFANSLEPWWWAAWIGPIPLLLAALRASRRETAVLAAISALAGTASIASYYAIFLGIIGTGLFIVLSVLAWVGVVATTRAAVQSRAGYAVFVYPALWAALDTIIAAVSPDGTIGSLAYSQMDALAAIQIAALAGTPGIVFIVSQFASIVAIAWHWRNEFQRPWLGYGLPSFVVVSAIAFGVVRLITTAEPPMVTVGLLAVGHDHPAARQTPGDEAAWSAYRDSIPDLVRQGAKIVILPENISALDQTAADRVRALLARIAQENSVYLVAGVALLEPAPSANRAWMFAPTGEPIIDYAKRHLIPGFEARFAPGSNDATVTIDGNRFGIAICKDMDFPALGRGYARLGVSAMLVPAWDFKRDAWSHARPAVLRGIEGGFTVVRSTRDGLLTVSDRYGRMLAVASSTGAHLTSLVTAAPLGPGELTVYARIGDLFGWICVAAATAFVIARRIRRRSAARPSVAIT